MATLPVDELAITARSSPHVSTMAGVRLSTSAEPNRLVKTHCWFCGQQCGIQLKGRDNQVIGFEPWDEFPFNRRMLCPKGVKSYLQNAHPDRLTQALRRDPSAAHGFSPRRTRMRLFGWPRSSIAFSGRMVTQAVAVLGGANLTTEKTYLLGKFARMRLRTPWGLVRGLAAARGAVGRPSRRSVARPCSRWRPEAWPAVSRVVATMVRVMRRWGHEATRSRHVPDCGGAAAARAAERHRTSP